MGFIVPLVRSAAYLPHLPRPYRSGGSSLGHRSIRNLDCACMSAGLLLFFDVPEHSAKHELSPLTSAMTPGFELPISGSARVQLARRCPCLFSTFGSRAYLWIPYFAFVS